MTSPPPTPPTWGPLQWDGTVVDLERCARDLLALGAPPDAVVSVSFTSYRSRMVRARPAPPFRPSAELRPPPTARELAERSRLGRRASQGRP